MAIRKNKQSWRWGAGHDRATRLIEPINTGVDLLTVWLTRIIIYYDVSVNYFDVGSYIRRCCDLNDFVVSIHEFPYRLINKKNRLRPDSLIHITNTTSHLNSVVATDHFERAKEFAEPMYAWPAMTTSPAHIALDRVLIYRSLSHRHSQFHNMTANETVAEVEVKIEINVCIKSASASRLVPQSGLIL